MASPQQHRWVFNRIGGFDQALIQTREDLLHLGELDQKLWAALSCPVKGLEFDEHTLELIDSDKDGRVRAPEILAAVNWATKVLKDPAILLQPESSLPLTAFNEDTPEGAALLASAKEILKALAKTETAEISLEDTADQLAIFAHTRFNGDGVIQLEVTDDPELQGVMHDIMTTQGEVMDLSGQPGINQEKLSQFFADLQARSDWQKAATENILPFAKGSTDAFAALQAVRAKIDDFFSRERLAKYDPRSGSFLNKPLSSIETLGWDDLSATCEEVLSLPLAQLTDDNRLPLANGINPAWEPAVSVFKQQVVTPILGEVTSLGMADWELIKAKFAAYGSWVDGEKGCSLAGLSHARIDFLLAGEYSSALEHLIAKDLALAPQVKAFAEVDKILAFRQNLKRLLNNFVNFTEFYSSTGRAIFQAGTLYLDGRACELCIRVEDVPKHATLAGLSKCCLAYCELSRSSGEKMTVVAAFTGGDSDYLLVGRNGLFYDRQGRDWDATIVKLIENPIGISQAFFAPYKRFIRFIETQVAKNATAADLASDALLTDPMATPADPTKPAPPPAPKPKFDIGMIAALGVAVGGITTAMGMLLQAFFGLGWLMPLGLLGLVLLISGPSMFIAWLKLHQRNLGPILDATGWAVNGRIKINVPFGHSLTQVAKLPAGASRSLLLDPYQEKATPWGKWLTLTAVVLVVVLSGLYKLKTHYWPWQSAPIPEVREKGQQETTKP